MVIGVGGGACMVRPKFEHIWSALYDEWAMG